MKSNFNQMLDDLDLSNLNIKQWGAIWAEMNKYLQEALALVNGKRNERTEWYAKQVLLWKLDDLPDEILAVVKSFMLQHDCMHEMVEVFPNLKKVLDIKPLEKPLYLSEMPLGIFGQYEKMNIFL